MLHFIFQAPSSNELTGGEPRSHEWWCREPQMNRACVLESVYGREAPAKAHFWRSTRNKILPCLSMVHVEIYLLKLSLGPYLNNDKIIMGKVLCYEMFLVQCVVHTCNPSTLKKKIEDCKSEANPGYIANSRSFWVTWLDPVKNNNTKDMISFLKKWRRGENDLMSSQPCSIWALLRGRLWRAFVPIEMYMEISRLMLDGLTEKPHWGNGALWNQVT